MTSHIHPSTNVFTLKLGRFSLPILWRRRGFHAEGLSSRLK